MRIEKINENKIRIYLNLDDLSEKHIDLHSFMANPIESQSLFWDVLQVAERETGFSTKDYRISIEALAMADGSFVLTVTRDKDSRKKKHFEAKRKYDDIKQNHSVFAFESFDDFIEFCTNFKNSRLYELNKFLKKSTLYELNSTYYLVFETETLDEFSLKSLYGFLSEFSTLVFEPDLFVRKLQEYGKVIVKSNVVNLICKNFK